MSGRSWIRSPEATDKSLKLVVEALPFGAQNDENCTTTGPPASG